MSKLHLRTPRLSIRDFREHDWQAVVHRTSNPEVARYLICDTTRWTDEEMVLGWIREQRSYDLSVLDRYLEFAVLLGERNIGDVGFRRISHTPTLAEVGWVFDAEMQGQGYATEAASALIDWSFCHLRVRRITATCDARNRASYRLMERLGMRREAHHRQSRFVKGAWIDELVYAVLDEEWATRTAPVYHVLEPLPALISGTPSYEKDVA